METLVSLLLIGMFVGSVRLFWKRDYRAGYAAAAMLAAIPVLQVINNLFFSQPTGGNAALRGFVLVLVGIFDLICLAGAALLYRISRRTHDRS